MQEFVLYLFIVASVVSILIIILNRNVFYAALALLVCLISLAGIYALLNAEFLAITQLLIYVGGVMVLIIFGIMLTNRISGKPLYVKSQNWIAGISISVGLCAMIVYAYTPMTLQTSSANTAENHIQQIGKELMSTYAAPFELSGILLLVCLVGAALTASSFKKNTHG
ncbi:MAG: NADH-quinone oxidoreductase subunit J [Flammeovirgaceae bacterium]|nr:NADH-quinone oxidoreductase subunit J [Flammeovirgaceae bacterium]